MPYTIEDWRRETEEKALAEVTPERLRQLVPREKLREALPLSELLADLTDVELEEIEKEIRARKAQTESSPEDQTGSQSME